MAKRLTDTEIWSKPYFRELPPRIKLFWKFLNDNCDAAGVWDGDFKLASFQIGEDVSEEDFDKHPELFQGRVEKFNDHKWLLPTFVPFQYTLLSFSSRPHISVLKTLEKHGLLEKFKPYIKDYDTVRDSIATGIHSPKYNTNTRQGTRQDKDKIQYGKHVRLTKDEAEKLLKRFGSQWRARAAVELLDNYLEETGKHYKSDYLAILRWVEDALAKKEKAGTIKPPPKQQEKEKCRHCGNEFVGAEALHLAKCPKYIPAAPEVVHKLVSDLAKKMESK